MLAGGSSREREEQMRKTLPVAVALAMASLGIVGVDVAVAAEKAPSTIEVTKATGDTEHVQVRGEVTSPKSRCTRNRKVAVYHDVAPPGPSEKDFLVGETTTNDNGRWSVASVALPDRVYAVVAKKKRCKGDTSPTVKVDYK
jgi:hypothetical protein